jgi:hypothetical protein
LLRGSGLAAKISLSIADKAQSLYQTHPLSASPRCPGRLRCTERENWRTKRGDLPAHLFEARLGGGRGVRNDHHIGRVGTYSELCAEAGLVSFHFVNITDQRPSVASWRGTDARFGTNPVCIAIPGPEPARPIILDMAMSVVAMGKVRGARNKGEQLKPCSTARASRRPTPVPWITSRGVPC